MPFGAVRSERQGQRFCSQARERVTEPTRGVEPGPLVHYYPTVCLILFSVPPLIPNRVQSYQLLGDHRMLSRAPRGFCSTEVRSAIFPMSMIPG